MQVTKNNSHAPSTPSGRARSPQRPPKSLPLSALHPHRGQSFIALAFDTTPGYVDTQPFPAAPVKLTYQAIYRVGDNRAGQWSKPLSVTVGG